MQCPIESAEDHRLPLLGAWQWLVNYFARSRDSEENVWAVSAPTGSWNHDWTMAAGSLKLILTAFQTWTVNL